MLDNSEVHQRALQYARLYLRNLAEKLGAGTNGAVWKTAEQTAIKSLYFERQFSTELACYQRLAAANVRRIRGLAVPRLVGFSAEQWVVEITIVARPWLLDFGKAYLDKPPEYPADAIENHHQEQREI